ncbi:MAG: DUF116 domain-containing protein [Ignavibacteriales bacterium]|nr:MAG: DUF116 domain-containing protein [Ignavibacteriales bacterium]
MEAVTYSLKYGQLNSETYYQNVRVFTDTVLCQADNSLKPIVEEFIDYLESYNLEEIREIEEYILELLSFGILWKSYSGKALSVHIAPFITLARMAEWRKKHQQIKPYIDFARGILTTLFLLPRNSTNHNHRIPTLEQVDYVCKWFEATGEFREQALRFIRWRAFWGTKTKEELLKIFFTIDEFTKWFEEQSEVALGKYTENVDNFLKNAHKHYKWREDRIQCTRSRIEYHLNMVGAELMNRAFRTEFNTTEKKVVLVPGCMRIHTNEECKAKKVKEGLTCEGCTPQCRVNQLREMGKKNSVYGEFDVYIIPHASDLSLWSLRPGRPKLGVIASACVTTLVEGGWELKRYDVPAQCVLLDYSGCKKHWCSNGNDIPTMFNVRELKRIVS